MKFEASVASVARVPAGWAEARPDGVFWMDAPRPEQVKHAKMRSRRALLRGEY